MQNPDPPEPSYKKSSVQPSPSRTDVRQINISTSQQRHGPPQLRAGIYLKEFQNELKAKN